MKPCSMCGALMVVLVHRTTPTITAGMCLRCDRRHCTDCEKALGKPVYVPDPTVRRCPAGHII